MFKEGLLNSVYEYLEKIFLIYRHANAKTKKYIKEYIEGITIDGEEGYLSVKFSKNGIKVVDDETGKEKELENLSESEVWDLAVDLKNLLEELGEKDV